MGAAAWAVAAVLARASGQTCDTTAAFPTEQDTQCIGLGADTAARSAIECAQNCCQVADNGCEVWIEKNYSVEQTNEMLEHYKSKQLQGTALVRTRA